MPYAMLYSWIYPFHVVLVSEPTSFHAFHVYGLIYMFYVIYMPNSMLVPRFMGPYVLMPSLEK